ncbi:CB1 cannabinoid receptor-interacting protein 1-like [Babylonia areolata]|uniref:CB1 cannabinoid receptor-interacting protein 1-like n=1 Tax=Babylonia areolata TaxID=304850 RepID=UPI003FD3E65C
MVTRFEVLLELKTRPDNQTVSFKQDGKRFANATTVKLCVDQAYTLTVHFRPPYKLLSWLVEDESLAFQELAPTSKREKDMTGYSAGWSTEGFTASRDGQRYDLKLRFTLENDLVISTSMQVKFYGRHKRTASLWGQPMHVLDLSCDSHPGQSRVTVRRGSIL